MLEPLRENCSTSTHVIYVNISKVVRVLCLHSLPLFVVICTCEQKTYIKTNKFKKKSNSDKWSLGRPAMWNRCVAWLRALSGFGCCCSLIFLAATLGIYSDVAPLEPQLPGRDPTIDFSEVPGGCNITSHSFGRIKYCASFCASGQTSKRRELCHFFSKYSGITVDSQEPFTDKVPFLEDVSCGMVPILPASALQTGDVVPCWQTNLDPTPGIYRCNCPFDTTFCQEHSGNCTKLSDPAGFLQAAQQENSFLVVLFGCFLAVTILCALPCMLWSPYALYLRCCKHVGRVDPQELEEPQ